MNAIEIIAHDLFEKVRSRFSNLQMGDANGAVTTTPEDARFFDFNFAIEGEELGRVSISINDVGNLKIFYSQSISDNSNAIAQSIWYDFLKEMRFFAKRRLLRFDTRDISKGNLDKNDFQYLAQNGPKDPNMNESTMFGSSKTSHRKLEDTDLIIRHTEAIDPSKPGARSRKIKNLFIQNNEGERFKFPFIYLPGARAMQRHISNGGYPHDDIGKKIIEACEEILKLSDFNRKVKHATLNDGATEIIEKAGSKLKSLRHHVECMSKQKYYESWLETQSSEQPKLIELDAVTFEDYKSKFTVSKFDEALAEVFPILHAIMQEESEVDLDEYVQETVLAEKPGDVYSKRMAEIIEDLGDGYFLGDDSYDDDDGFVKAGYTVYYQEGPDQYREVSGVPMSPYGNPPGHIENEIKKIKDADMAKKTSDPVDELAAFESWTDEVVGESLSDEQLQKLEPLVQEPLPAGANGEAEHALAGIGITDPELIRAIRAVALMPNGADADTRDIIKTYLGADSAKLSWGEGETTPQALPQVPAEQPTSESDDADHGGKELVKSDKIKEVAKLVSGFYNRENGTWTKGEHGVVTHVKRQFSNEDGTGGEREAELAAQLISYLNQKNASKDNSEVSDVKRLAGLK